MEEKQEIHGPGPPLPQQQLPKTTFRGGQLVSLATGLPISHEHFRPISKFRQKVDNIKEMPPDQEQKITEIKKKQVDPSDKTESNNVISNLSSSSDNEDSARQSWTSNQSNSGVSRNGSGASSGVVSNASNCNSSINSGNTGISGGKNNSRPTSLASSSSKSSSSEYSKL